MVRFAVLGPLMAENEHGPVDLRGPRHRAVLARLLVAGGRVVPVTRLIDDLWDDDPPPGALGAVQTFVGALRKALEPDRPPRTPSRLLVTAAPGYALRADPEAVDAWRFEAAVATSAQLLASGQTERAHALLDEALGGWRGPAYAEFAELDWARGTAARLDELRLLAVERRAEAAVALGRAAESVADLRAHVTAHPLREDGWWLLALALYRTGRQGDALATLRQARDTLRAELGLDPGPRLRQLESDILAQAPHLAPQPTAPPPGPTPPGPAPVDPAPVDRHPTVEHPPFVGRTAELADLERAAAAVTRTGHPRLALVSGAAGAGKTALASTLLARLRAGGWTTAWGSSPELPGAPSAWPWTQVRASLDPAAAADADADADADTVSPGDPVAARFQRQRAASALLAAVSATAPVLLVFDDLHWADEETLALLTALATDRDAGPVLVVGTYRATEISTGLAEALGRAARAEPTRVYLGGLTEPQVRQMVTALTSRVPAPGESRVIHARSAGNPFFVRELTRLWETEGDAALHRVPAGVRDVIRHRLAGLTGTARTHLRQAAVLGQQVDLDVLVPLAGDEDAVLDSVESALLTGFLVEQDADRLRFAHALVQETLYADTSQARRARWHASAAAIIAETRPDDVAAIAHHLLRAGHRASAARTAHYTRAAAEQAERHVAPHEAARLWRETVAALDRAGSTDTRARLTAVMGMVRALAVTGDLHQARGHRAEAVTSAEALGDPVLTAQVIGAFDVPAIWTTNDDENLSARLVEAAERTLARLPAEHETDRARLLSTIAVERRADAGPRGAEAARQAEAIARARRDPALLAHALNARYLQTFHRAGLAPERARIGAELLDLAGRHRALVTSEVLGHLILIQSHAALADLAAADRHAAEADRLAERHELPLVGVFTDWYAALRLAITGRRDEARAAYRAAGARLAGSGMPGMERGVLPLALLSLTAPDVPAELVDADWGPHEPWARPLVLLAQGRREQAFAAARLIPDAPRDLLFEARTCLHAMIAVQAGDRPAVERLYDRLLPAADELAGAGSGLLTLGPTARHLGHLAAALGRHDRAEEHHRQAQAIADRVGASRGMAGGE
ncbi:BTAD domain-containing putative transcriptional regulator [Goodfellowiella coeruleoviolacea]|uniref:DNA-binding transcriptional activator of the SARP family n=1 Tax=Goodfellowiella coeruleoviolacea TaxID=334858 RepID=A0AAE3GA15_9PSEU|nr:BTAD domain-containing putative transcriptional regulator [Goodfellowiella coeruleoviolacea]MCP2163635.1 DNA-binding transcriptional activator of the SARP family [Goodfellowiella coeruleoviolacea]